MLLSIVIPAFNEAESIVAALTRLQAMRSRDVEVVLADGGSSDATRSLAAPLSDRIVVSDTGRARQMNAGAAAANGDTLLFLHADSLLPADADECIAKALGTGRKWGRFDVSISGSHYMFPIIAWLMNRRSGLTGIATGDQGLFVTRAALERIGGFPNRPLMEDITFCTRMKRVSPPACVDACITTSGRRWEKHGVWRTILLMWHLRFQYYLGADPEKLHAAYCGQ